MSKGSKGDHISHRLNTLVCRSTIYEFSSAFMKVNSRQSRDEWEGGSSGSLSRAFYSRHWVPDLPGQTGQRSVLEGRWRHTWPFQMDKDSCMLRPHRHYRHHGQQTGEGEMSDV